MEKLKPCDCKDMATIVQLNEQGIGHNEESLFVVPNSVVLHIGHTEIKISQRLFKIFAEWYLKEQIIN